jgi:hypothetical protein
MYTKMSDMTDFMRNSAGAGTHDRRNASGIRRVRLGVARPSKRSSLRGGTKREAARPRTHKLAPASDRYSRGGD